MPVWESEKVLERKPPFRSLPSIPTDGWVSPLQPSPCNEYKKIRILKLWKNHRSASPHNHLFQRVKVLQEYKSWRSFYLLREPIAGGYNLSLDCEGSGQRTHRSHSEGSRVESSYPEREGGSPGNGRPIPQNVRQAYSVCSRNLQRE